MEQINTIELADESVFPDENVLKNVLGDTYHVYLDLLNLFQKNNMECRWRYYRDGRAWLCKVQRKSRTVAWMSAWKGYMKATVYFPDRYENDLQKLAISDEMKKTIAATRNVGKSKPCMFEITNGQVIQDFEIVMKFKIISR